MKPSQLSKNRPQHVMVFGDPKTGKSTLVAKLLQGGFNLTWISMDNGHEVLFKMGLSDEFLDEHLNIIIIPDSKEQPTAIKTCLRIVSGAKTSICDTHGQVDCSTCKRNSSATWSEVFCNSFGPRDIVVYDHIGQLANSAMSHIFKKDNLGDEDKPTFTHYMAQGFMLDRFLTNVQQASYNVICITHVLEVEMQDDSKKLVPLVGTKNFSSAVGKYFDHLVFCHMVNARHKYGSATTYQNKVVTGSRSDKVIEGDKEASLVSFFDGSIVEPEKSGGLAAVKVLSSASEKKPTLAEKTPLAEEEKEKVDVITTIDESQNGMEVSPTNGDFPKPQLSPLLQVATDRAALLAKLKGIRS